KLVENIEETVGFGKG
nr:phospholipase D, PLD {N-terminal} {EC 3.1.4.4} [Ricinus communis=castor beans, Hale, endosperms, Peptide Partial, 15 aa] [Ricinus communis]